MRSIGLALRRRGSIWATCSGRHSTTLWFIIAHYRYNSEAKSGVRHVRGYASKSAHSHVFWWLIGWLDKHCLYFFSIFLGNHLRFGLYFCFRQRMITRPIDRLELAEFGPFVSGKYRFSKCADFEAKTGCADFEACPRTQSINQPSNNMGVRRLWGISSYCITFCIAFL